MSDKERKLLGERLREAREYVGLSQEEVADHINIPRPAVSQMENGKRGVDALELRKLAQLYERPVGFFTGGEEEAEPQQLEMLRRAARALSVKDRDEVLRFAEFLRGRSDPEVTK
jgi:transcriptional regulator with XRE-family HTH domain